MSVTYENGCLRRIRFVDRDEAPQRSGLVDVGTHYTFAMVRGRLRATRSIVVAFA